MKNSNGKPKIKKKNKCKKSWKKNTESQGNFRNFKQFKKGEQC